MYVLFDSIMNLFGVLKYKKMGEDFLRDSGLPFTIIRSGTTYGYQIILQNANNIWFTDLLYYDDILSRPGRLTDGPYTSYDLNTLLKATAGERRAVVIGQGNFEILGWSCCLREFEIACFT